jgi:chlorophyllide a reductase subunit X
LFAHLADQVASAPPRQPKPQTQDELLALFSADAVGRDVVLQPANQTDMLGHAPAPKPSFEVVYDEA